ncbi:MarR family transcriptional regulator [Williamsia sp. 1138]|uniref:MarR family winged helix-turn-helix transcriptional regulator n=1 Tax=Williamsia sp. 1138 TaxID=1903117 RepID=UPI000A111792|nr:MarR family transcriptional regulator [Williamsia sp. 1138]
MPHDTSLEAALLRMINLFMYSSHSNAARRRFETATGLLLPRSGIETLNVLARGPRGANELAKALRTDSTQSSRTVAALVRQGFVIKARGTDDRRQVVLKLSDSGDALMHQWQMSWKTELQRPLDTWNHEDVETLTEWLQCASTRLTTVMEAHAGPDLVDFDSSDLDATPYPRQAPIAKSEAARCTASIAEIVYLVGRANFEDVLRAVEVTLTPSQYFALADIQRFSPTTISDLASRLDLEQSAASRAVSTLDQQGLITREPNGADRRSKQLTATPAGIDLLVRSQTARLDDLRKLFSDIKRQVGRRYAELTERYLDDVLRTADVAAGRYL